MRRTVIQLASILLLLFAQQAAFTHEAWHAGHPFEQQHDNRDKASFQGSLCNLHSAFSQVLGVVHSSPLPVTLSENVNARIEQTFHARIVAEAPPFLSRGPPSLL